MQHNWKEKANQLLEDLALDIITNTGSVFCWGEVQVPECLQEEVQSESEK
jgi:hypothetical protein